MRRRALPVDVGLAVRMLVVVLVLTGFYTGLGVLAILSLRGASENPGVALIPVILVSLVFVHYWFADRAVLSAVRANEVTATNQPSLHAAVERLSALAEINPPRIAI